MAVNAYDSRQAFRQDAIARLGEKAVGGTEMNADQRKKFNESPFMQQMKVVESATLEKLNARDRTRQKSDPAFKPTDSDFNAPKSFDYKKNIDYYGILGLDEFSTLDEIKKSYRKLSLTYHPDKLSGKTQEEKDEAAVIFIELKNAYKVLSDNPTRRQYDHDRDRDAAASEVHGNKAKKAEAPINAAKLLQQLNERAAKNKKQGSQLLQFDVKCKLEKFIFGGHKCIERSRRVKDKMEYDGFREEFRLYRIDIPRCTRFPYVSSFRRGGDQYLDQEPDSIEFKVIPKQHSLVESQGNDLILREDLKVLPCLTPSDPYLQAEATILQGRHVILWGQNPFYSSGSDKAVLRVNIRGEGANEEGTLKMSTGKVTLESSSNETSFQNHRASGLRKLSDSGRKFLQAFGLEPPFGLQQAAQKGEGNFQAATCMQMQKRIYKMIPDVAVCEVELERVGQPLALYTKPPCTVTFYMNRGTSICPLSQVEPKPMLAISLTATACASRKLEATWDKLKGSISPWLRRYGLFMVSGAVWSMLPRQLEPRHVFNVLARRGSVLDSKMVSAALGWKKSGDAAFRRGDTWHALLCYNLSLEQLDERDECIPKVLSNRAACFARLGDYSASMADAHRAAELEPQWGRAWSRVGLAAWNLSGTTDSEALDAYTKAVEYDPSDANLSSLQSTAAQMEGPNADAAHEMKENGNIAMKSKEYAAAVAAYTIGIGKLPVASDKPASDENLLSQPRENDPSALLRAILFSNRAAAFVLMRRFDSAVADGYAAVASSASFVKARCQLGTALLGKGMHQLAYDQFARAVQLEPDNSRASKGRKACLAEFLLMRSLPPRLRIYNRYYLDVQRPKGSTRVFAISDIFCDRKDMEDWMHAIDDYMFQDDILIVAGNLANTRSSVQRGLSVLKSKFRRVFYTFGNVEMWLAMNEWGKYPDSIAKINSIFEACDELGVDVFPAPVCEGLMVVPLISWYNAEFDEKDPVPPSGTVGYDDHAKWPMDPDMQLSKYLVKLNEAHLMRMRRFSGTVISFSHFLPRRELPLDPDVVGNVKTSGCMEIDEQARRVRTKLHVFGHSGQKYTQVHDGVKYVQCPVGQMKLKQPEIEPRLMMVHNGKEVCMQEWGADGEPPLGFIKKIQHFAFFVCSGLTPTKKRELINAADRMSRLAGIEVSFTDLGSTRLSHKEFTKEIWPEIAKLDPWGASCALHIVADNLEALKACLASNHYRTDFMNIMKQFSNGAVVFQAPLGMDLVHTGKARDDPTLIVFALRLSMPKKDVEAFEEQAEKVVASMNAPAFSAGKLAVAWQKTGYQGMQAKELAKALDAPELNDNGGMSHLFTIYVNNPETFKLISGSKTFNRLRSLCGPHQMTLKLPGLEIPPELAYVIPLEFSITAAAPKPPKKTGPRRKKG